MMTHDPCLRPGCGHDRVSHGIDPSWDTACFGSPDCECMAFADEPPGDGPRTDAVSPRESLERAHREHRLTHR